MNYKFDTSRIQVLEGLEAVRKRPAMYIGDTSVKGLHHLVSVVVDSCIDEALAGYCNDVQVFILPDNSIKVIENGRHGIPVDVHQKEQRSAFEVLTTVLVTTGRFSPKTSIAKVAYYSSLNVAHYNNYIVIIASKGDDAVPIVNDWRDLLYLYSRYCRNIEFFHARSSSGGLPYLNIPNGEFLPNCLDQSLYYLLLPKILNASNHCVANNLLAA